MHYAKWNYFKNLITSIILKKNPLNYNSAMMENLLKMAEIAISYLLKIHRNERKNPYN